MSTTIQLQFPAGRFHATPWGRHVNEAATEWPPSPWRLLRALIWVWKHKAPELLTTAQAQALFEKLAQQPPVFRLPDASQAHTRHYMPWFKKGPYDKTLVFDAFVVLNKEDSVSITWPIDLDPVATGKLATLLDLMGHLGRSESWCLASISAEPSGAPNCVPVQSGEFALESEIVPVLCVDNQSAFRSEHLPQIKVPKPKKGERAPRRSHYDPSWHLCMDTADLQKAGWSDPPGSKWVRYERRADSFLPGTAQERPISKTKPVVARFLLDSVVRPLISETLPVAEKCRRGLMGNYRKLMEWEKGLPEGASKKGECSSATFSGKSSDGTPLSGHRHAYFVPLDKDGDGRIDQVMVFAAGGFDDLEIRALQRLNWIPSDSGHDIRLVLLSLETEVAAKKEKVLISTTPYISTRFPKKNGTKRDPAEFFQIGGEILLLIADLKRQIAFRGLPEPLEIEPMLDSQGVFRLESQGRLGLRPIQFSTRRRKEERSLRRAAGFFRIKWANEMAGPLFLGHSSHFGMGQFHPVR